MSAAVLEVNPTLCLGIDSEFAMIESVMTVIHDSNIAPNMSKPVLADLLGLIFITRSSSYWFMPFDYSYLLGLIFITGSGICLLGLFFITRGGNYWFTLFDYSCLLGLIFITGSGIYWFMLFDYYSCVVALFLVTFMECFWLVWGGAGAFKNFSNRGGGHQAAGLLLVRAGQAPRRLLS